MAAHNELGKWGEDLATAYLEQKGYTIVERDWKSGRRDIDIIAIAGNTVVFVEVKTRKNSVFGEPEEAIDHYVKYKHIRQPIRFDIISIVGTIDQTPDIRHIQDVTLI